MSQAAGWVQGYYGALAARYRHFAGKPQQQVKLAELILATLHPTYARAALQDPLAGVAWTAFSCSGVIRILLGARLIGTSCAAEKSVCE